MLLIGAYRDNEVRPRSRWRAALDELRASGRRRARDRRWGRWPGATVDRLVADTLHRSAAEAAPLARLVREKTGGNPFFAIQFLTALHSEGLITFDRAAGRWRWDMARIRAEGTPTTSSS